MKKGLIKIVKFYKKNVSPALKTSCIFTPTCSEYAIMAIKKHNLFKVFFLIICRIVRCNPLCKGGFDPVPDNRNDLMWLY